MIRRSLPVVQLFLMPQLWQALVEYPRDYPRLANFLIAAFNEAAASS